VAWFPDRRGLVTGLAAAGFAAGGVIGGPLAAHLITTIGVLATFALLGAASATILGSVALFMELPPEQFCPPGWQAPAPIWCGSTRCMRRSTRRNGTACGR
jgi:OFA family oxalate/formate antiporter-like MFS transporter